MNGTDDVPLTNGQALFGAVDYTVFLVMLAVSTSIGIYFGCFGNTSDSTEEYLLGGRRMKILPIAISLIASQISGIAIMTVPVEMYGYGTQYWIVVPTIVLVGVLLNYVVVPVFYNNHISNCYQYLELRFGKTVKEIITLTFLLKIMLILPVVIFIPALALSQVTGTNIHLINGLVCGICVFYTLLGGIKAVVWTDVIQAGIMLGSCMLILCIAVIKVGGVGEVIARASAGNRLEFFNTTFDLTTRQTFWNTLFGGFVMWAQYVGLNQSCIQRIVSVPSLSHARWAISLFCVGFLVIMSLNCFTGLVMFAHYHDCDPIKTKLIAKADRLMPFFVQENLADYLGLPGVFISSVFSAGLSTMSANLNSLAAIMYQDYIRKFGLFEHTEARANSTIKLLTAVIGIYCIFMGFVVEQFGQVLQMVLTISGVVSGAVMGVFLMGMLWPWTNRKGALAGVTVSVLVVAWIVINGQIALRTGELSYPMLPSRTDGCEAHGYNITSFLVQEALNVASSAPVPQDSFSVGKIAFMWYPFIGFVITWVVGVVISHLTGSVELKDIRVSLIAPPAQWLLPLDLLKMQMPMTELGEKTPERLTNEWVWKPNGDESTKQ